MIQMEVWRHRTPLEKMKAALKKGEVVIGFIGGSITDERPGHNWPESVLAWLIDRYPNVRFIIENAAIGATGSDFAVLRVERDLISRGCDIVFIDYAVNDYWTEAERRERTREGLIRKLLNSESAPDLVLAYTFNQEMYRDMISEQVPPSIADFEKLAKHYEIGSVWMGLYALNEVKRGFMKWEEWLPDGLHPTHRGSLSYGQSIIHFLEKELVQVEETSAGKMSVPTPINHSHWGNIYSFLFSNVQLQGPWSIRRSSRFVWVDQVLETNAIGACLSFTFNGNGLMLNFDFGKNSSEFRYKIDEGEWQTSFRDRPDWVGESGWLRPLLLTDDLESGEHTVKIEVTHGDRVECSGTNFRLTHIGIIKYES